MTHKQARDRTQAHRARWTARPLGLCLSAAVAAFAVLARPVSADEGTVQTTPASVERLETTQPNAVEGPSKQADFASVKVSRDARHVANWVVHSGDNQGMAFAIIDKPRAKVLVFDPSGRIQGAAPVLLGMARGDHSVPGIGERKMSDIRPEERTTPAGRFVAEPGRNLRGEDIVWIDYDAAVSMHRVRANNPKERRLQRLATPTATDNRISYGCVNVPAAFYDAVVSPAFRDAKGIVYVLPDTRSTREVFGSSFDVKETHNGAVMPSTAARPSQVAHAVGES